MQIPRIIGHLDISEIIYDAKEIDDYLILRSENDIICYNKASNEKTWEYSVGKIPLNLEYLSIKNNYIICFASGINTDYFSAICISTSGELIFNTKTSLRPFHSNESILNGNSIIFLGFDIDKEKQFFFSVNTSNGEIDIIKELFIGNTHFLYSKKIDAAVLAGKNGIYLYDFKADNLHQLFSEHIVYITNNEDKIQFLYELPEQDFYSIGTTDLTSSQITKVTEINIDSSNADFMLPIFMENNSTIAFPGKYLGVDFINEKGLLKWNIGKDMWTGQRMFLLKNLLFLMVSNQDKLNVFRIVDMNTGKLCWDDLLDDDSIPIYCCSTGNSIVISTFIGVILVSVD